MSGITWTGQVYFTDSSDVATTGVATLTLTPDIGVSNLPALVNGTPGLPPVLRNVTVNQVAYGTTPPASSFTLVSAGGAGTASVYDLTLYVNSGQQGASGSTAISSASDFSGTLANGKILVYNSSTAKWTVSSPATGDIYAPSSYSSYSGNAAQATLATLTIPAQPFDWRPDVAGFATATGTANTKVELLAQMTNPSTGGFDQVGYGPGVVGAAPPPIRLSRAFGQAPGSGSYGRVYAGSSCTVALLAKQVATTNDNWAVSGSSANFSVKVNPIP